MAGNHDDQAPPALLFTGVEEHHSPEHVEKDDGHGHERCKEEESTVSPPFSQRNEFSISLVMASASGRGAQPPADNITERSG